MLMAKISTVTSSVDASGKHHIGVDKNREIKRHHGRCHENREKHRAQRRQERKRERQQCADEEQRHDIGTATVVGRFLDTVCRECRRSCWRALRPPDSRGLDWSRTHIHQAKCGGADQNDLVLQLFGLQSVEQQIGNRHVAIRSARRPTRSAVGISGSRLPDPRGFSCSSRDTADRGTRGRCRTW